ncbi:hypothetical protein L2E82_20195 [Cichorium intybus]|uniref:Uncharacterized protein n=1 Tax=Cichorium intybus TaxID=13427 RepID=A0ACB9DSZ5_CICIN|nr:hypothetical protein L2E82_20195 [Cichorium intybus]
MDSAEVSSAPFYSFKSKKILRSSINKQHSTDELAVEAPDLSPWSSKTSENPTYPPRRSLTRRQVSQAAKHLRKLELKTSVSSDSLKSSATLITKPNSSKALPERTFAEVPPEQRTVTSSYAMENPNLGYGTDSQQQPVDMLHSFKRLFLNKNAESVDQKLLGLPPGELSTKLPETPIKSFDLGEKGDISSMDGNPPELILTSFTPSAPRKTFPTKITQQLGTRRALFFDTKMPHVKRSPSDHDDELNALFASIRESNRKYKPIKTNYSALISQSKWRKQMIARLPKLFDSLLNIFLLRSVISKNELVQMIISGNLETVERSQVVEQLRLMLQLAPEWIQEKMTSTGDLLICVNKIPGLESIRTRLSEAK